MRLNKRAGSIITIMNSSGSEEWGQCTNRETKVPEGVGLRVSTLPFLSGLRASKGETQGPLGVEAFQGLLWCRGRGGRLGQRGGLARGRGFWRPGPAPAPPPPPCGPPGLISGCAWPCPWAWPSFAPHLWGWSRPGPPSMSAAGPCGCLRVTGRLSAWHADSVSSTWGWWVGPGWTGAGGTGQPKTLGPRQMGRCLSGPLDIKNSQPTPASDSRTPRGHMKLTPGHLVGGGCKRGILQGIREAGPRDQLLPHIPRSSLMDSTSTCGTGVWSSSP